MPFLLVHGLASNLHLWDGVAQRLAERGHTVAAVDLRGHGQSDKPSHGYDFTTITDDLVELVAALGLDRPVAAGQSWGANVVLELGWRQPALLRGVACVDGGWIELRRRFPQWEQCAGVLAPPVTAGRPAAEVEAGLRARHPDWPEQGIAGAMACFERRPDGTVAPWLSFEHHLAILRSLWEHEPSSRYRDIALPVLLLPAGTATDVGLGGAGSHPAGGGGGGGAGGDGSDGWAADRRRQVDEAAGALPRSRVHWMAGDHDLHAQQPDRVAALLHQAVADGFFLP